MGSELAIAGICSGETINPIDNQIELSGIFCFAGPVALQSCTNTFGGIAIFCQNSLYLRHILKEV